MALTPEELGWIGFNGENSDFPNADWDALSSDEREMYINAGVAVQAAVLADLLTSLMEYLSLLEKHGRASGAPYDTDTIRATQQLMASDIAWDAFVSSLTAMTEHPCWRAGLVEER